MTDVLGADGPDENSARARFRGLVTDWREGPGRVSMCVNYTAACVRTDEGWKYATVSVQALAPDGIDAVMDCMGQWVLQDAADAGSSRLRACSIAEEGPGITTIFARMDSAILSQLVAIVDASGLTGPIAATYPLAQTALQQPHPRQACPRQTGCRRP